ncbi:hypothetical protein BDN72DRAFT_846577 [Pluteus cervinus]|uniref:Uncharacterized protein n=1 Tax=Pluteus cervinus TaxID=181527 RepID=A0ACD3AGR4_9AGAR|nr:hypothetical protein BDN72DRAFT_846577 [Pluteus cervinus]
MSPFTRLLALVSLVATVSGVALTQRDPSFVPPALLSTSDPSAVAAAVNPVPIDLSTANPTDINAITAAIQQASTSKRDLSLDRRLTGYTQVFDGTGTDPSDRDASVAGKDYKSVKTFPTYDVDGCEQFCQTHPGCVFVNLYYIFNANASAPGSPEIRCASYTDVHSSVDKTNFGGQQLLSPPAGKTYIQQSTGYTIDSLAPLANPPLPEGYKLVFGPVPGANVAPGFLASQVLGSYDVQACANLCNAQTPDPNGGVCLYFNIFRALTGTFGTPVYTCSLYYLPTDASTATLTSEPDVTIGFSRGYSRISVLIDGGFEGYSPDPAGDFLFFTEKYGNWTSTQYGSGNAQFFDYAPYARSGHSVALLGNGYDFDTDTGTITPTNPLNTVAGKQYVIAFFQSSSYSGPDYETNSLVEVIWNGVTVFSVAPGYETWTLYTVTVTAQGNDVIEFTGGHAPSWDFLDDIYVFLA